MSEKELNKEETLSILLDKCISFRKDGKPIPSNIENRILKTSNIWNKREVLKDFYRKLEVFLSYDEDNIFPIDNYIDILLDK